jgi:hypothetical protein
MIELVILACLMSDPTSCQDVPLKFSHDATSMRECAMSSQIEGARWAGDHPEWQIKKMSCARPTQSAQADPSGSFAPADGPARLASRIVD